MGGGGSVQSATHEGISLRETRQKMIDHQIHCNDSGSGAAQAKE